MGTVEDKTPIDNKCLVYRTSVLLIIAQVCSGIGFVFSILTPWNLFVSIPAFALAMRTCCVALMPRGMALTWFMNLMASMLPIHFGIMNVAYYNVCDYNPENEICGKLLLYDYF